MAFVKVLQCDECGARKDVVNHWFAMEIASDDNFAGLTPNGSLICSRMADLAEEDTEDMKHLCGQQCAGKMFQRWMDTGSIEKVEVAHPVDQKEEADGKV